jgi:CheY-like chemotaxis protein
MNPTAPRVLVVDDNDALRDNLAECLEDEGYVVSLAEDGHRALALLAAGPLPDVVLLDLVMPRMDGRELVARIRQDGRYADVRLVLTSGLSRADDLGPHQADAFLPKPFGLAQLLATLRAVRAA